MISQTHYEQFYVYFSSRFFTFLRMSSNFKGLTGLNRVNPPNFNAFWSKEKVSIRVFFNKPWLQKITQSKTRWHFHDEDTYLRGFFCLLVRGDGRLWERHTMIVRLICQPWNCCERVCHPRQQTIGLLSLKYTICMRISYWCHWESSFEREKNGIRSSDCVMCIYTASITQILCQSQKSPSWCSVVVFASFERQYYSSILHTTFAHIFCLQDDIFCLT